MVYDKLSDGDKVPKEIFDLEWPFFHATIHLKVEAEVFFS